MNTSDWSLDQTLAVDFDKRRYFDTSNDGQYISFLTASNTFKVYNTVGIDMGWDIPDCYFLRFKILNCPNTLGGIFLVAVKSGYYISAENYENDSVLLYKLESDTWVQKASYQQVVPQKEFIGAKWSQHGRESWDDATAYESAAGRVGPTQIIESYSSTNKYIYVTAPISTGSVDGYGVWHIDVETSAITKQSHLRAHPFLVGSESLQSTEMFAIDPATGTNIHILDLDKSRTASFESLLDTQDGSLFVKTLDLDFKQTEGSLSPLHGRIYKTETGGYKLLILLSEGLTWPIHAIYLHSFDYNQTDKTLAHKDVVKVGEISWPNVPNQRLFCTSESSSLTQISFGPQYDSDSNLEPPPLIDASHLNKIYHTEEDGKLYEVSEMPISFPSSLIGESPSTKLLIQADTLTFEKIDVKTISDEILGPVNPNSDFLDETQTSAKNVAIDGKTIAVIGSPSWNFIEGAPEDEQFLNLSMGEIYIYEDTSDYFTSNVGSAYSKPDGWAIFQIIKFPFEELLQYANIPDGASYYSQKHNIRSIDIHQNTMIVSVDLRLTDDQKNGVIVVFEKNPSTNKWAFSSFISSGSDDSSPDIGRYGIALHNNIIVISVVENGEVIYKTFVKDESGNWLFKQAIDIKNFGDWDSIWPAGSAGGCYLKEKSDGEIVLYICSNGNTKADNEQDLSNNRYKIIVSRFRINQTDGSFSFINHDSHLTNIIGENNGYTLLGFDKNQNQAVLCKKSTVIDGKISNVETEDQITVCEIEENGNLTKIQDINTPSRLDPKNGQFGNMVVVVSGDLMVVQAKPNITNNKPRYYIYKKSDSWSLDSTIETWIPNALQMSKFSSGSNSVGNYQYGLREKFGHQVLMYSLSEEAGGGKFMAIVAGERNDLSANWTNQLKGTIYIYKEVGQGQWDLIQLFNPAPAGIGNILHWGTVNDIVVDEDIFYVCRDIIEGDSFSNTRYKGMVLQYKLENSSSGTWVFDSVVIKNPAQSNADAGGYAMDVKDGFMAFNYTKNGVQVYKKQTDGNWGLLQTVSAPSLNWTSALYGRSLAIDKDTLAAGASQNGRFDLRGDVFIFQKNASGTYSYLQNIRGDQNRRYLGRNIKMQRFSKESSSEKMLIVGGSGQLNLFAKNHSTGTWYLVKVISGYGYMTFSMLDENIIFGESTSTQRGFTRMGTALMTKILVDEEVKDLSPFGRAITNTSEVKANNVSALFGARTINFNENQEISTYIEGLSDSAFTIEFWIKYNQNLQNEAKHTLVHWADSNISTDSRIELQINIDGLPEDTENADGQITINFRGKQILSSNNAFGTNWHHIAICNNEGVYILYINGVAVDQFNEKINSISPIDVLKIGNISVNNQAGRESTVNQNFSLQSFRISHELIYIENFTTPTGLFN